MTRRQLKTAIIFVIAIYSVAVIIGLCVYLNDSSEKKVTYAVFKDFIPFIIALPAAYLGYCFQRRSSYMLTLRQLWSNLIESVNAAIQYTHLSGSSRKEYEETLMLLSKSIDEVRAVYKNIDEKEGNIGHYPFESLKSIYTIIAELGFDNPDTSKGEEARNHIKHNWGNLRRTFLQEFDRPEPTVFDSPYISSGNKKNPDFSN